MCLRFLSDIFITVQYLLSWCFSKVIHILVDAHCSSAEGIYVSCLCIHWFCVHYALFTHATVPQMNYVANMLYYYCICSCIGWLNSRWHYFEFHISHAFVLLCHKLMIVALLLLVIIYYFYCKCFPLSVSWWVPSFGQDLRFLNCETVKNVLVIAVHEASL